MSDVEDLFGSDVSENEQETVISPKVDNMELEQDLAEPIPSPEMEQEDLDQDEELQEEPEEEVLTVSASIADPGGPEQGNPYVKTLCFGIECR